MFGSTELPDGDHSFCVPIVDGVENAVLNPINLRYMRTVLQPRDDNVAGFYNLFNNFQQLSPARQQYQGR